MNLAARAPKPLALAVLLMAVGLAGCGGSSNGSSSSDPDDVDDGADPAMAAVRIVHAVADAPEVNVVLENGDSTTEFDGLGFRETTGLTEVEAGTYDVAVNALLPDGNTQDDVLTQEIELSEGDETTLIAAGSATERLAGDESAVEFIEVTPPDEAIREECGGAEAPCRARYTVVHAAPSAGPVDISALTPDNESIEGAPSVGLAFDDADFDQQVTIELFADPGRRIRMVPTDQENTDSNVVFDSGSQLPAVPADEDVLLIAIDNIGTGAVGRTGVTNPVRLLLVDGDGADDIVVFRDKDAQPAVRAAHLSQDAGDVDILASGQDVGLNDVPFTTISDYLPVSGFLRNDDGSLTVDIQSEGSSVVSGDIGLTGGDFHTGYAVGLTTTDPTIDVIASADAIRPVATEARVRLVHAAAQAGPVDVDATPAGGERQLVAAGFEFKDISPYRSLPVDLSSGSREYTFEVFGEGADPADATPAIQADTTLSAGSVTTAIASNAEMALDTPAPQLEDDTAAVTEFKTP